LNRSSSLLQEGGSIDLRDFPSSGDRAHTRGVVATDERLAHWNDEEA
jgi:hypothetical protein